LFKACAKYTKSFLGEGEK